MNLGLKGKRALITGGSLGIGKAIATRLAQYGAHPILVARGKPNLDRAQRELEQMGATVLAISADLNSRDAFDHCRHLVTDRYDGLDILINNAGYYNYGNFLTLTDEDWDEGFNLKFYGYIRMSRTFWPMLKAAQGNIVHIIGINARAGTADFSISGATGSALVNLTKSMAITGKQDGVRINAVAPGIIETDRFPVRVALEAQKRNISEAEAEELILKDNRVVRAGRPEEVADAVCFLASERAAYINGAILDVDGGLNLAT